MIPHIESARSAIVVGPQRMGNHLILELLERLGMRRFEYGAECYPHHEERFTRILHDIPIRGHVAWLAHSVPDDERLAVCCRRSLRIFQPFRDLRPSIWSLTQLIHGLPEYIAEWGISECVTGCQVVRELIRGTKTHKPAYFDMLFDQYGWALNPGVISAVVSYENILTKPVEVCTQMLGLCEVETLHIPDKVGAAITGVVKLNRRNDWAVKLSAHQVDVLGEETIRLYTMFRGSEYTTTI